VALALVPGIGPRRLETLLSTFGTADGALSAPFAFLCRLPGISRAGATAIKSAKREQGRDVMERVTALGGRCLLAGDAEFPGALAEIPDPPALLFVMGRVELLTLPGVAIVGSRDHSPYGGEVCRLIADRAARAGLAVVSGMARGLDAVAHHAALDAGGATIGVLGNGLGVVYPAANRALYERVAVEGLMLTEFPPGERPHHGSFPRRNRLISGLASVTLVVEAVKGSGTMLTVDAALAQGRDVMAVPGPITSPTSEGTNRLIRDGAEPLLESGDLLRHYGIEGLNQTAAAISESAGAVGGLSTAQRDLDLYSPNEARLLGLLGRESLIADQLAAGLNQPVSTVLDLLCGLELAGAVEGLPGGRYRRRGEGGK
jgi:DNA processing protein